MGDDATRRRWSRNSAGRKSTSYLYLIESLGKAQGIAQGDGLTTRTNERRVTPLSACTVLLPHSVSVREGSPVWGQSDQPHGRYEPVSSRVLVVDDDPGLLSALPELFRLRLPTIAVDTCESVTSALERLGRHDYGAVISDVRMPKHIGLNLLDHTLNLRQCSPVLLLTAGQDYEQATRALHDGAFSFLFKPIDRDELVLLVLHALELHDMTHRVQGQRTRVLALAQRIKRIEAFYKDPKTPHGPASDKLKHHETTLRRTVQQMRLTQRLLSGTSDRMFKARQEQLQRAWKRLRRS